MRASSQHGTSVCLSQGLCREQPLHGTCSRELQGCCSFAFTVLRPWVELTYTIIPRHGLRQHDPSTPANAACAMATAQKLGIRNCLPHRTPRVLCTSRESTSEVGWAIHSWRSTIWCCWRARITLRCPPSTQLGIMVWMRSPLRNISLVMPLLQPCRCAADIYPLVPRTTCLTRSPMFSVALLQGGPLGAHKQVFSSCYCVQDRLSGHPSGRWTTVH